MQYQYKTVLAVTFSRFIIPCLYKLYSVHINGQETMKRAVHWENTQFFWLRHKVLFWNNLQTNCLNMLVIGIMQKKGLFNFFGKRAVKAIYMYYANPFSKRGRRWRKGFWWGGGGGGGDIFVNKCKLMGI